MNESTGQSFPRAQRLQVGYSPLEDRVLLRLTMAAGEQRSVWVPRRVMAALISRLSEALRRSHPAGEGQPAADAVMAMEHVAARSELAGQRREAETQAADGAGAGEDDSHERIPATPVEGGAYLITQERVEVKQGQVLVGLLGHELPSAPGLAQAPHAVGGLALSRTQAHELLRMLSDQADQAQWGLSRSVAWMRWLRRGSGGNASGP